MTSHSVTTARDPYREGDRQRDIARSLLLFSPLCLPIAKRNINSRGT